MSQGTESPDPGAGPDSGPDAADEVAVEPPFGADFESRSGGLRLARLSRGMSQVDLARSAGVTRQAIAGIESGRWDPSLKVALAIARALAMTVDEIFGAEPAFSDLEARWIGTPGHASTCRVRMANVGSTMVAHPLDADNSFSAGFQPADGVARNANGHSPEELVAVAPLAAALPTLVIAGCDPALPLLAAPLSRLHHPVNLVWVHCSSERAAEMLTRGQVHAAGMHVLDPVTGHYNERSRISSAIGTTVDVIGFCRWTEGLAVAPGLAGTVSGVEDLASLKVRIVNREPGSEARNVLEREMSRARISGWDLAGFDSAASGHILVASAIAAGLAGGGVTNEAAAVTYGLGFVPLVAERFDIVVPRALMPTAEVSALLQVLGRPDMHRQLATLPGYDPSICGEVSSS